MTLASIIYQWYTKKVIKVEQVKPIRDVSNNPLKYIDPTGHWQESDKNLDQKSRIEISRLTDLYCSTSSASEKAKIADAAKLIRKNAGKATDVSSVGKSYDALLKKNGSVSAKDWLSISNTMSSNDAKAKTNTILNLSIKSTNPISAGLGPIKASNIMNVASDDEYNDEWDSWYEPKDEDKLSSKGKKQREKNEINSALGKDRAKREGKSQELHDEKRKSGVRNDDNRSYKDLKNGNYGNAIAPQSSTLTQQKIEEAAFWATAGTVTYWVISEGSRLFPPRNLVPIP